MRSWREFFDEEFLSRLEQLHLIAKRMAARGHPGLRRSRRLGDGLEFADHRAYVPGDDIRFIDWPYFARMERLLLRMFHEHSDADVTILLDASSSMAPGGDREKFDYARRAAAALAYVAMGSLERVILAPFADRPGQALRTGRNRQQVFQVLDFLAELRPSGATGLLAAAEELARKVDFRGTVLILSDLLDCGDELSEALARLRLAGQEVTAIHLYSPRDAAPDLQGGLLLRQAETSERMDVHATPELLESYRRRWAEFRAGCERTCLSRGATYVGACTDVPFDRLILRTLRQAGVIAG